MILIINNGDKEQVPKLISYMKKSGHRYKVIDSIQDMESTKNVSGIILSGSPVMINGNNFLKDQEIFFKNIHALHKHSYVPVLGICFGSQFLNVLWGGKLDKLEKKLYGSYPVTFETKKLFDKPIPSSDHFHFSCRYIPRNLPCVFKPIAFVKAEGKDVPCIFRHRHLPIFGSLCHPEGLQSTHWFLDEFLKLCTRR